jgi:hypothetical protein
MNGFSLLFDSLHSAVLQQNSLHAVVFEKLTVLQLHVLQRTQNLTTLLIAGLSTPPGPDAVPSGFILQATLFLLKLHFIDLTSKPGRLHYPPFSFSIQNYASLCMGFCIIANSSYYLHNISLSVYPFPLPFILLFGTTLLALDGFPRNFYTDIF